MQSTTQPTRQPRALYFLFLVELWERYGFYTVRGILVLYLTKVFLFSDNHAYGLFGAFTALLWLTPVAGGYLADRLLGFQRALIIGGVSLTLGYACLAVHSVQFFYLGLSLILIGNGFFKANVASLVGSLYDGPDDSRRDGGFTIYYMGINIGGLLPPLFVGFIIAKFGWGVGFASAAVGMFIGLLTFLIGRKALEGRGSVPDMKVLTERFFLIFSRQHVIYAVTLVLAFVGIYVLHHVRLSNWILEVSGVVLIALYLVTSFRQSEGSRNKMLGCLALTLLSIGFWTLYQQAPMTVNLFTLRNVDRTVYHWTIPTVMFQALNPIFIIALTPFLSKFWTYLGHSRWSMPTSLKFAIAILLMGSGFLVLAFAAQVAPQTGIVSPSWIVVSYFLQTLGELAIQPIGLAMMTALAPPNLVGMMVGTWFFASAASNAIAGSVAKIASISPNQHLNPSYSVHVYGHAFFIYGLAAIGVGILTLFLVPKLSRMME